MNHVVTSVAALALATGLGATAHAEPFNGPFVGAQAGWSKDDLGKPSNGLGGVAIDRSRDSFSGGVFAGYDQKLSPRVVVGAEAGVQFGADDSIVRDTGVTRVTLDPKRSLDFTARAGYLVTDNTLLYARGGYTNARVRTSIEDAGGFRSASDNRDGWLVGGGIERAISDNVSARLEYRYSDLSEGGGKFDRHQALVGIAYRF
jgi:outer membrane immunogenic protein